MGLVDAIRRLTNAPAFKFLLIIVLILALAVPLLFVYLLVDERARYAAGAEAEIGQAWGGAQTIRGPFVIVPTERERSVRNGNETRTEQVRELAVFLPETLAIAPSAKTEMRSRGIYSVPVYRSTIAFTGRFDPPETRGIETRGATILWEEAVLTLLVTDVRGIKQTAGIRLGPESTKFRSGPGVEAGLPPRQTGAIHVPLGAARARQGFDFAFTLDLAGSSSLNFVPAGGESEIRLSSDWPHPSFSGAFLPETRKISSDGFEAFWKIPRLARGQGQTLHVASLAQLMQHAVFGVRFFQPVQFYSLAERALKYAQGFIAIVFFTVFVMEMKSARRVHWIQYLFVGLALAIFYLVLIGTAEHIGFEGGYLAAAAATSLLVASYVGTITGSTTRGAQIFAVIATIYGLLYLLLRVEDYALLIGSVAAFALLAAIMFATRNVDWSRGSELAAPARHGPEMPPT
jgi:inner membrane protein